MATQPANLVLHVELDRDATDEEIDRQTRWLRDELAESELMAVEALRSTQTADGAKSAEVLTLGALAIAVLPNLLPSLIEFLKDWSLRGSRRSVKVKVQQGDHALEVDYDPKTMTAEELDNLIDRLTVKLDSTRDSDT